VIEKLEKYHKDGLLMKQTHPTKDLYIWNYTPRVQYESLWDDVTMQCRGLITNSKGDVISKPFGKFFNYEEVIDKNLIPWDSEYAYIQDKMDGSLGILFFYDGEWIMSTRGSFTSEQSIRGLEILKSKYDLSKFMKEVTYLCEIIYPENRIVVNYGCDNITFLSVTTPEIELNWYTARSIFHSSGIKEEDIVESTMVTFNTDTFDTYKKLNTPNSEGFVVRFYPSNFRMKIKFEEYVRLHRILTNVSSRDIWEYLKEDKSFDELLEKVPDEFNSWVKETVKDFVIRFENIEKEYKWIFNKIRNTYFESYQKEFNRAEFAELAKRYSHPSILFNMLDGKDYKSIIWKILYPPYSKPFKKDEI
jgi:RNA ligase